MSVITAYDFAEKSNGWAFGASEASKALRELADRIDARRVIVEKVALRISMWIPSLPCIV